MNKNSNILKKTLLIGVIPLLVAITYFSYHFFYLNSEISGIKAFQEFAKISKTAHMLKDERTLEIIDQAKSDNLITRGELKSIKASFSNFERDVSNKIKPAEQREKEFMERRAKFLAENNKVVNNE